MIEARNQHEQRTLANKLKKAAEFAKKIVKKDDGTKEESKSPKV